MYPQVDFTETQAGVVGLILGAVTMVNWWFAMFSDRWYGDLGRSFGEGEFNEAYSWGVGEYDSEDGCDGFREGV